jgi:hypothetical protein
LLGVLSNVASVFLIGFLIDRYRQPHLILSVGEQDKHDSQTWLRVRVMNGKMPTWLAFWTRDVAANCHVTVTFKEGEHKRFSMPGRWIDSSFPDIGVIEISEVRNLLSKIVPAVVLPEQDTDVERRQGFVSRVTPDNIVQQSLLYFAEMLQRDAETREPTAITVKDPHFAVEQTTSIYPGDSALVDIATRRREWDFAYGWNSRAYYGLVEEYKLPLEKNYIVEVRVETLGKEFKRCFKLTCGRPYEVFHLEEI